MKSLKIFFIAIAILSYAVLITIVFIKTLNTSGQEPDIDNVLIYFLSGLCGLVGGIVATAFGVEIPEAVRQNKPRYRRKMSALGNLITTGSLKKDVNGPKELFGNIYAWVYTIVGLAAVVIWIIDKEPHSQIKNIATIFFGLFLVVVANFFDEK